MEEKIPSDFFSLMFFSSQRDLRKLGKACSQSSSCAPISLAFAGGAKQQCWKFTAVRGEGREGVQREEKLLNISE